MARGSTFFFSLVALSEALKAAAGSLRRLIAPKGVVGTLIIVLTAIAGFAEPIPIDAVGTVNVVSMEYHPHTTECFGRPCLIRTLSQADAPAGLLSSQLTIAVESTSGIFSDGSLSLNPGNNIILGSQANAYAVGIDFITFDFHLAGRAPGPVSGWLTDGVMKLSCLSECYTVDIQNYVAAPGPSIIPITGMINLSGSVLTVTLDPSAFRFDGVGSTAYIDVLIGTFSVPISAIP